MKITKEERLFINTVWTHYKAHARHDLPWRKTTSPYHILVSELMLQQTQVARVLPKYREFLKVFPTVRRLADAPLGDVLRAWQGLGYNRRAKFLWETAQAVRDRKGVWPRAFDELRALRGIGTYTAGAVMNFAYNEPVPLIETNVRTVYIRHFFHDKEGVSDKELLPIIERTLDTENPREWNWALMDYGTYLKETVGNLNKKSKTYQKQSDFKTSNRFVRGAIVRALSQKQLTKSTLLNALKEIKNERVLAQLEALLGEGLVEKNRNSYRLP